MRPKAEPDRPQRELFQVELEQIIDRHHPLVQLGMRIDWASFEQALGATYHPTHGAPGICTRLMVALHYLKYQHDLSDENVVLQWVDDVISNVEAPRRFNTGLMTAFAMGALLLALTGTYVVVGFSVSLRSQEIAIRMAVGAQRRAIVRLVLLSGTKLAMFGCGLGLLGSFATSRLVSSFLFDVSGTDPLVYMGAALTMILMALLASAPPAVRAASINPVDALRST
jgi:ABC-type antimicrobial peptide transport system permease subunit